MFVLTWLAVWPDLAKFRHFDYFFKYLEKFKWHIAVFGKILDQLWQIFSAVWGILIL